MATRPKPSGMLLPMRVWDQATRLFHWALTLLLITSYVSISLADGKQAALWMKVHILSGEAILALLLFRILWGLFGSDTARFVTFLRGPTAVWRHVAHFRLREPDRQVGHNAAGGWIVLALLALIGVQVGTGLGANDDGSSEGPLAHFLAKPTSDLLSLLHGINFTVLAGFAGLHVLAVIGYKLFKGHDLLRPMITGKKRLPAATPAPRMASPLLAVLAFSLAAGVTVVISRL